MVLPAQRREQDPRNVPRSPVLARHRRCLHSHDTTRLCSRCELAHAATTRQLPHAALPQGTAQRVLRVAERHKGGLCTAAALAKRRRLKQIQQHRQAPVPRRHVLPNVPQRMQRLELRPPLAGCAPGLVVGRRRRSRGLDAQRGVVRRQLPCPLRCRLSGVDCFAPAQVRALLVLRQVNVRGPKVLVILLLFLLHRRPARLHNRLRRRRLQGGSHCGSRRSRRVSGGRPHSRVTLRRTLRRCGTTLHHHHRPRPPHDHLVLLSTPAPPRLAHDVLQQRRHVVRPCLSHRLQSPRPRHPHRLKPRGRRRLPHPRRRKLRTRPPL
eukprot:Rhum_TRINITY_DN13000_c0_g1::Rhum_TRINITY_DN13000_c0_g1_i3::g.56083::m.56083